MAKKAPVSVCFIVRDDADSGLLEECFDSVRPHVEEIVVVDTGSKDKTPEIARRYAEVFEVFTGCNDPETGLIADFSKARNKSFDLARQPWVMWMDSDDVLAGGEHLAKLVEIGEHNRKRQPDGVERDWCYLFPYEYVYSPTGQCVCLHYRERLLSRRAAMRWVNPVHEVMLPADRANLVLVPSDDVVFKHQRQRSKKPPGSHSGRNLRILQKLVEKDGCDDARQFYYLGLEYANANNAEKAIFWLMRYYAVSGWEDEKAMAALKLADLFYSNGQNEEGIEWGFRAVRTQEAWGEGYFAVARGHYNLAVKGPSGGDVRRNWEKCAFHAQRGLELPPTKTMLFVNPLERLVDAHVFLTMARSQMGDARSALKHAEEAKKSSPTDSNLLYNLKIFEKLVAREDAKAALDKLVAADGLGQDVADDICRVLAGEGGTVEGWPRFERPPEYPRGVEAGHFPVARKAPHARAFALPEESEIDDLPVVMTDGQVEAATILVWKELVLHDELLAAESFLANAPYRAKHSPLVEAALARTQRMTAWMNDSAKEQAVNTPEDPTIENGVALPAPLTGQLLDRSLLALRTISKGEKVLDLGCFDGGMTNRWGLAGHDVTGVDLCEGSIALARRKAEEFQTGAKFVCSRFSDLSFSEEFDVVATTDTYEHVRDHVKDMIAPARRALKPGGRMIVVTPHGSWMRGKFVSWAHPWRWGPDEGRPWNTDLPHAHLVAPTPWSVAGHFRDDGWWVKDSFVAESENSLRDVEGQGNVYCEALLLKPTPAIEKPLDVVFACGDAWQAWNPRIMDREGIGGSETMVVHMARRLAGLGHRVRVFTSTGKHGDGIFDGVEYRQTGHLKNVESCDVLVGWRNAELLASGGPRAKLRLLWVHDVFAHGGAHRNMLRADRVLALSEWHRKFVIDHHNLPEAQVLRTRNGIDLSRFSEAAALAAGERNPFKAVYSSSPDRGLPVLLEVWPEIRKRAPQAELHVFYGFFNWLKVAEAQGSQEQIRAIEFLERRMHDLKPQGVRFRDKVDQKTLAKEFLSAGVWSYPTWFSETSCAHPDTRISVPGDHRGGPPTVRIADLVGKSGFPVYAFNEKENRFQLATCTKVWQTKIAKELVAVRLDDGQLLRLTPEHLVLTFDGEWVEAGTLKPGDSLRALHYRYNVAIRDADGRWANEHRLVGEWKLGRPLVDGEVVDHIDLMRLDNRPESLNVMTAREHGSKTHRGRKQSRVHEAKRTAAWRAWAQTEEGKRSLHVRNQKTSKKLWDRVNAMSEEDRIAWLADRGKKRSETVARRLAEDPNYRLAMTRQGQIAAAASWRRHEERMKDSKYAAAYLAKRQEVSKKANDVRWGRNHKVVSVERIVGDTPVFDMEVEGLHNFVADGVVVHNCLTAMEAQAAGLRCVTSSIAALNETVGSEHGVLIDGDWLSKDYQKKFVDEVVHAMTCFEGSWLKTRDEIRERARRDFCLDRLAVDWEQVMRQLIEDSKVRPLVPYRKRADFVRDFPVLPEPPKTIEQVA